jgi:Anti-repressor SinI
MNKMIKVDELLDQEWVDLILEALEMGITEEEIKSFFVEKRKGSGFT